MRVDGLLIRMNDTRIYHEVKSEQKYKTLLVCKYCAHYFDFAGWD